VNYAVRIVRELPKQVEKNVGEEVVEARGSLLDAEAPDVQPNKRFASKQKQEVCLVGVVRAPVYKKRLRV
jgi:hypothetical protein